MMAPKYERARALGEVVQCAIGVLEDPIDKIELTSKGFLVSARDRSVLVDFNYENAYAADGSVMPGSGRWTAWIDERAGIDRPAVAFWPRVARLFSGWRTKPPR